MCCDADWKREIVPDHKFDFINVRDFHRTDFFTCIKYVWRYILLLKSFTVYGLDIFVAVTMISSEHWTTTIARKCGDDCAVPVRFDIAKWIFVGCIIFSFLLLGYETWKAKNVIDSRDISYAFTNLIANDYYSFKNYDTFCLFCHIDSSTKRKDDFAFWIFFTFKGWKRLLLADGPRQSINALVLYSFAYSFGFQTHDIPAYWEHSAITAMLLFAQLATVLIFAGSLILLVAAALLYVPLLCYIQGNLKEYVCHKVDKRIAELIKKKTKQRIARQAALEKKLANGSIKTTNTKGESYSYTGSVPQPTLPRVDIDDDDLLRAKRKADRAGVDVPKPKPPQRAASALSDSSIYPGPPPATYESFDSHQSQGQNQYSNHQGRSEYDRSYQSGGYGYDDYESSASLAAHAAPLGMSYPPPAAQQTYPPPLPHSRSGDVQYRQQCDQYRPQPHPIQRQPSRDAFQRHVYDDSTPSLMPYDVSDSGSYLGTTPNPNPNMSGQRSRSPVYQTQANAGHGWGSLGQGQGHGQPRRY